ncbi:class I SAM-dependent methyltransferase [Rhodobacteraceae bacterium M382]|nr:class I SAM-dependent methyltransferase [Rhodobacteraceae bacterium M382]
MTQATLTDFDTLSYYQAAAPVYRGSGPEGTNRFLKDFLDHLPRGARILDLGCGGGHDSGEMIRRGFDVTACDGSTTIARQAESRIGQTVQVLRFQDLAFDQTFDAIWASASLLHVPRPALTQILARVHRALRPGGWHLATYKAQGTEGRDSAGRYFNHLTVDDAHHRYQTAAAWQDLSVTSYSGGGYENATSGPWICVRARAAG